MRDKHTKGVALSDLCPPAPDQVDLVLGHARHTRVPAPDQLGILVHLIWLHLVEDDAVHVLASRQHLTEAPLDLAIHLAAFLRTVDQGAQGSVLLVRVGSVGVVRLTVGFACR